MFGRAGLIGMGVLKPGRRVLVVSTVVGSPGSRSGLGRTSYRDAESIRYRSGNIMKRGLTTHPVYTLANCTRQMR